QIRAITTQSNPTAALLNQSQIFARSGHFKECIDSARLALVFDPHDAMAFNNVGMCSIKLELWDEGLKSIREAIRLDPTLQLAKDNLAWAEQEKARAAHLGK